MKTKNKATLSESSPNKTYSHYSRFSHLITFFPWELLPLAALLSVVVMREVQQ